MVLKIPFGGARLLGVLMAFALGACAHAIPLKGMAELPAAAEPMPARVGVYYSPEFRAYMHSGEQGGDTWNFPLGPASVNIYDGAFAAVFTKTVPVDRLPPQPAGGPVLDAVIEARIVGFDFNLPLLKTSTFSSQITYNYILYSPDGARIASWTVTGFGAKRGQFGFDFARWPGESADLAMQDAASKFVTGFRTLPEVMNWLRKHKGSAGN